MANMGRLAGMTTLALVPVLMLAIGASTIVARACAPQCERAALAQQDSRQGESHQACYDGLDLEEHSGYTSEYIFGFSKGVVRSTLSPAVKPVLLLVTVPVDLALLPFAAIGGFLR